jgi:hypothetical protein
MHDNEEQRMKVREEITKRAETEARVAELEAQMAEVVGSQRNADKSLPTWAQVMNRVALLTEQSARLRAALESLQSDAQCTIDLYNKIGPTWTSRDSGAEYYDASYVIGSAEERIATIKAALADTKGTT